MYKITLTDDSKVLIDPDTLKRVPKTGKIVKNLNSFWKNRERDKDIKIEDLSKKKREKDK